MPGELGLRRYRKWGDVWYALVTEREGEKWERLPGWFNPEAHRNA